MKDIRDTLLAARRSDGKLVARPLSPHLQNDRCPVSMALSISHFATGVMLSVGALLMACWLVAAAPSGSAFTTVLSCFGSGVGVFLLLCWVATQVLHLFLDLRHLVWDAGWELGGRCARLLVHEVLSCPEGITDATREAAQATPLDNAPPWLRSHSWFGESVPGTRPPRSTPLSAAVTE